VGVAAAQSHKALAAMHVERAEAMEQSSAGLEARRVEPEVEA
jgi:hypothetical protein